MKLSLTLLLFTLLFLAAAGDAMAEKRGIFLYQGLQQWVNFDYTYDGQDSSGRGSHNSSSQQHFEERYHVGLDYSLLNPNFFRGRATADFRLGQEISNSNGTSESGSQRGIDYNFSGDFLHRAPLSLSFYTLSQNNHIQTPFVPAYDLTTTSNFLQLVVKNTYLPTTVAFTRTTNESTGNGDDRTQTYQQVRIQNHHSYRGFSISDLTLTAFNNFSETASGVNLSEERKYQLDFRNALSWGSGTKTASLITTLLVDQNSSIIEDKGMNWNESLTVHHGAGLTSGVDYSLFTRDVRIPNRDPSTQTSNLGRVYLQHSLFQSLTTRLDVNGRIDNLSTGKETDYGGSLSFAYNKRLPSAGALQLQYLEQYQVTDRNVLNATVIIPDERHTATDLVSGNPAILDDIRLLNANVDTTTVIIQNVTDPLRNPTVGIDYQLQSQGAFTVIHFTSAKTQLNDVLSVAYSYFTNPQLKYDTSSRIFSGTLLLREGRHRIFASYSESDQNLLAGRADTVRLLSGTTIRGGFETNVEYMKYGGDLELTDSIQDKHKSFGGFFDYKLAFARGILSLNVADRYLITDPVQGSESRTTTNSFSAGTTYSKNLFNSAQMVFYGFFTDTRGDNVDRDDVTLRLNIRWLFGKFSLSLLAQQDWRIITGLTTRNDQLQLRLQRSF